MSTELTRFQPQQLTPAEQFEFAARLTEYNQNSLLPPAYWNNPSNVLLAINLGQAMGLTPAEAVQRIHVIEGKPTASAELITANVRKAGHRLRVEGDDTYATATIWRADDPDYPFTETRTIEWAQKMGLLDRKGSNYQKQPGVMLKWRAITACARLACPEALYGVAYTADEMGDLPGRAEPAPRPAPTPLAEPAQIVDLSPMWVALEAAGVPKDQTLAVVCEALGREVATSAALTQDDVQRVLSFLDNAAAAEVEGDDVGGASS